MPPPKDRAVAAWLFVLTFLVLAMVGVGGFTRLSHAGLSIVEWNPVMGALPPLTDAAWAQAFAAYRASPEGATINAGLSLEGFQTIFFIEWAHRLLGRGLGVVFALPWLWFLWRKRVTGRQALELAVWFGLGGLQGALGWFMVKSGLVDLPRVSHYRLTAHLLMALFVACGLFWQGLRWWSERPAARGVAWPSRVLLGLVTITITWGGFMAGLKAGLVSDTFPLMYGQWVPTLAWLDTLGWLNPLENPVAVHFLHRVLAVTTLGFTVFTLEQSRRGTRAAFRAALATLGFAALQVLLGLATLWLHVPMVLAVLHQVNGALLLLSTVALWFATPTR